MKFTLLLLILFTYSASGSNIIVDISIKPNQLLLLKIHNKSDNAISVYAYEGVPIVRWDAWSGNIGHTLINKEQNSLIYEGSAIMKSISIDPGHVFSTLYKIDDLVLEGLQLRLNNSELNCYDDFLDDFLNSSYARIIARVYIDQKYINSNYIFFYNKDIKSSESAE